jgi:hypothetical protein
MITPDSCSPPLPPRVRPAMPPGTASRTPPRAAAPRGTIGWLGHQVQVGARWIGATVRVVPVGQLVHAYWGETLIRVLAPDPNIYYIGNQAEKGAACQHPCHIGSRYAVSRIFPEQAWAPPSRSSASVLVSTEASTGRPLSNRSQEGFKRNRLQQAALGS